MICMLDEHSEDNGVPAIDTVHSTVQVQVI